jgi:secreted trypsin-like serine protease
MKLFFLNFFQLSDSLKYQNIEKSHEFQADSGSPLIQYINGRAYVIGITSFAGMKGKIKLNPTTVYTQVSKYNEWIENTIKSLV